MGIYEQTIANIIHHTERLRAFSLRLEIEHRYPISLLLFNIVLEILPSVISQEK